MGAAFGRGQRVNLVDDHGFDLAQILWKLAA